MDVDVEELKVKCSHVTLLRLKKFKVDAKILNEIPMIDILMDTFSATYIHNDIFKWASTNFKLPKNMQVRKRTILFFRNWCNRNLIPAISTVVK
jgi:hypothetical protein